MTNEWGIPSLRPDRLATVVPERVYTNGSATYPAHTLFIWRTAALSQARGCTVAFFRWDAVFQSVLNDPDKYAALFLQHGIGVVCEPDCSMWRSDPSEVQMQSVCLARGIGRRWQEAGLLVAPVINWSDESSYHFAFRGVPHRAPVIVIECRTLQSSADWPYFLAGLQAAVECLLPQNIVIYGGWERRHWLSAYVPAGPAYSLLPSWQTVRHWRRRQQSHNSQLALFSTGGEVWADADQAAAVPVAAA
ncbi:MAG TPA: DUF4417 domain-containing protein [Candidatus Binatia bacterium]|nr:DUF4417 domain-containing protein [Candidatus Binatia bacterium]